MGEITTILKADGRDIGKGKAGTNTKRIQKLHSSFAYKTGESVPFKEPEKKDK